MALPGDLIQLAPNTYALQLVITRSGTLSSPITLRGAPGVVIDRGTIASGTGITLTEVSHWRIEDLTVTNAKKGVYLFASSNIVMDGLHIHSIGEEGLRFKNGSSYNIFTQGTITDTGRLNPEFGEGVYVGSFVDQWPGGLPDQSDNNQIVDSHIGPGVTAEAIDVKAGTSCGHAYGNTLDGRAVQSSENSADSVAASSGNTWRFESNTVVTASIAVRDGFQTNINNLTPAWGHGNIFSGNAITLSAGFGQFGFRIDTDNDPNTAQSLVYANNTVFNASNGVSNIPLTP